MFVAHPRRLADCPYVGYYRYFLTLCTAFRRQPFTHPPVVATVLRQLRHSAADAGFALIAYCFMPDHLHVLAGGERADARLQTFVGRFKQASGYWFRKTTGNHLWQAGYVDHILRDADATNDVVRYILAKPVRAGLATTVGEYPFAGSGTFDVRGTTWDGTARQQG
jgi:putative transposase